LNRAVTIILISFFGLCSNAQSKWEFKPKIEGHEYYLLKGKIDGKYSIEMFLTETWEFCGESDNNKWNARGIRGWYQYETVKKKFPLVGSMKYDAPEYFVRLYVPKNPLDKIERKSCEVKEYKEIFIAEKCCSMNEMKWRTADKDIFLPVNLEEIHSFSWATNSVVILEISGLEFTEINLASLTGIEHIQYIDILSEKEIENKFYAIVQFGHMTNPGSNGSGHCGAGYERFLGYIEVNHSLELEKFEYFQTESCLRYIPEGLYSFDEKNPEKGIKENK